RSRPSVATSPTRRGRHVPRLAPDTVRPRRDEDTVWTQSEGQRRLTTRPPWPLPTRPAPGTRRGSSGQAGAGGGDLLAHAAETCLHAGGRVGPGREGPRTHLSGHLRVRVPEGRPASDQRLGGVRRQQQRIGGGGRQLLAVERQLGDELCERRERQPGLSPRGEDRRLVLL